MGIFLFILLMNLTNNSVSGTVTDSEMGDGLVMVNVKTSIDETYTDINGNYTIKYAKGDSITFEYVGYESKTVCVENCKDVSLSY